VGLSATAGQFFLTKAYMAGNPSRISVVGLSQVAFAMAFDVWVSAQSFSPVRIIGLVMVVASTAWAMLSMPDEQVLSEIEGDGMTGKAHSGETGDGRQKMG
jgi:drug/metabolite transporter (DMT)-like permease